PRRKLFTSCTTSSTGSSSRSRAVSSRMGSAAIQLLKLYNGLVYSRDLMTLPHPLPDELVELIARRFRVLGEPLRIRLLDRLRAREATVNELTETLGASQQNVS